jgi:D-alanyl-lipoteichoic acid acyltransferase DltB (MBOAT superfamily)
MNNANNNNNNNNNNNLVEIVHRIPVMGSWGGLSLHFVIVVYWGVYNDQTRDILDERFQAARMRHEANAERRGVHFIYED